MTTPPAAAAHSTARPAGPTYIATAAAPVAEMCPRAGHEYEPALKCRACAAEQLADQDPDTAPQRPVEAPEAIRVVAERHRARTVHGTSSGRSFAAPAELLQVTGLPVPRCDRCQAVYVDTDDGRASHRTVFGHLPAVGQ